MAWPQDTQTDLARFFTNHDLRPDGRPTAAGERAQLVTIDLPYPMLLAWE